MMKIFNRIGLWVALLLMTAGASLAQKIYTPEMVPNVHLSDERLYVSDPQSILSNSDRQELNAQLDSLRAHTQVETAVVLLPSIGERDIESFSTELFRQWGLGNKKANNGLLILTVIDQRKIRFEVGYGLEGVLTDARSSQIQRNIIRPAFKEQRYGEGLILGVGAIEEVLAKGELPAVASNKDHGSGASFLLWMFVGVGGLISFVVLLGNWSTASSMKDGRTARVKLPILQSELRGSLWVSLFLCFPIAILLYFLSRAWLKRGRLLAESCPSCGQLNLSLLPANAVRSLLTPYQQIEQKIGSRDYYAYACSHCAYREITAHNRPSVYTDCPQCGSRAVKTEDTTIKMHGVWYVRRTKTCLCCGDSSHTDRRDSTEDAALAGMILGAALGRGRSSSSWGGGGGFSGGSWGGGSSGGGGATSGW